MLFLAGRMPSPAAALLRTWLMMNSTRSGSSMPTSSGTFFATQAPMLLRLLSAMNCQRTGKLQEDPVGTTERGEGSKSKE